MNSRKNNRLEFYDYSQSGAYFVTICAKDKQKIFWDNQQCFVGAVSGRPQDKKIFWNEQQCSVGAVSGRPQDKLNHLGLIVKIGIEKISLHYQNITVDKYVIMPNHVHLIIRIDNNDINGRPMTAPTLSQIVNQFKGYCSKQIGHPVWQKSFHDHVIRNQADYNRIWEYVDTNAIKWESDCYYN